ncbi:MAG TPA: chemotaxis protein CheW, partial [Rhodocyclaceae bacterium]|nr:chemotaxis protein CheW [Rhodocyclaceae bacterium]
LVALSADGGAAAGAPAAEPADGTPARPGYEICFRLDPGLANPQSAAEGLLAELGELGSVDVMQRPQAGTDDFWVIRLHTAAPQEDVAAVVGFVASLDGQRITPLVQVGVADDPAGAYGFFSDADDAKAAPANAVTADDPDGAFGFFEPVAEPSPVAVPVSADDPDGAFGFFEPPPSAVVVPLKPEAPAAAARKAEPEKRVAEATIRVGVEKVDQLINLIGELIITQAMVSQSAAVLDPTAFQRLHDGLAQLERNTRDLQEAAMSIRMMPISAVFSRFPRVVRDLSRKLGKQVELKMSGEDTELDKSLIESIADPLTHLVRNSLDHGIEMADARELGGKPRTGTITLKASHQGGSIVIEVGDDGAGLNRSRILAKAREKGIPASDSMSDQDVWQLIFEPGFSTAEHVTEVSGRGVGMDVVKRNIAALGGRVDIESVAGAGTRMTVRLPLTLAILDGMSVSVGQEIYVIPLTYVIESLQAERSMVKSFSGAERLVQVREEYLPVLPLHDVFSIPGATTSFDRGIMVILEAEGSKLALLVDALVGQQQVVIKSLEANYRKVRGVSGATIMGDGHVALILDVPALAALAHSSMSAAA